MSIAKIKLPEYTVKQDVWNSITHGIGAIFGLVTTILMLVKICAWGASGANQTEFVYRIVATCLYGASMMITYTISCVYHALYKNNGKKVLRVIDHDTVYLLIAGTYSMYCLISLRDVTMWGCIPYSGWWIMGICWLGVVIGIVLNSVDMNKFIIPTTALYIIIGWTIILASGELINTIGLGGWGWLLGGGIAYSIGAILYGIGAKKSLWFHVIFHVFILIGTVCQFISIWCYVLA